jgi:hypothetical protein
MCDASTASWQETPLWVLHQIKLNTCAKQLTGLRHADDRVVDTVKQRDEGWGISLTWVAAAVREDCHTDKPGLGTSHLTHDLLLTRWSSERTARIAGRHFGRGHASNVAHFLIRCVDDNRSLLFDNHVSLDDRGLARRENELSS